MEILSEKVGEHKTIMELGPPSNETSLVRSFPETRNEGQEQNLLSQTHTLMGRHFEGPEFYQSESTGRAIRGIEFVDTNFGAMRIPRDINEQISKDPIDQPWRGWRPDVGSGDLGKSQFQFVQGIMTGFIDAGSLTGRADEETGKHIGEGRMPLPVSDHAAQEIGPTQKRTVGRGVASHDHMIASPGSRVSSIQHELFRA